MVKNFKTVAIISPSEGFIVKGIETKLEEIGFEYTFSLDTIDAISMIKNVADVFVLYLQYEMDTETLVYIKDMLSELNKRIIIVGEPIEFTKVEKVITESLVFKWLDRPLDMNLFLRSVELCAFEDIQPAVKKTILIVDDDIFYMRMVYDWLKDDYRIGMASSGLQAIKWLAKNKPDLILLDYKMPALSGPQFFEMLKEDAETSKIPVMFLTGKSDKESLMSVINLKPVDYILKTIDKPCLLAKIKYFFDMQRLN
ncbi:MAG: response regulator [Lachnospiraceae bacterium]|nr:response regulator [Lachnospiraceae bacterium]